MSLPPHDVGTGTLPPGRYRASFADVEQRYVADSRFAPSKTRRRNWDGFEVYREAWAAAEQGLELERPLVHAYWVAGSFISDEMDPDDIDVTVVVDHELLSANAGRPGMGNVKKLYANRTRIAADVHVEPFVMRVRWEASTLLPGRLSEASRIRLAERGGYDNFWQRIRPDGQKASRVQQQNVLAERGYVEVAV